jgi:membrane protease YdiL (CAAX protease family)
VNWRNSNVDLISSQSASKQPSAWLAVAFLIIALSLIKGLARLLRWFYPAHAQWSAANPHLYSALYYICEGFTVIAVTIALAWYYRCALFLPRPLLSFKKQLLLVVIVSAPLFCWVVSSCVQRSIKVLELANAQPEQILPVARLVWKDLTGGTSVIDIAYFSLFSFLTPALEEIVFTGFLLNCTLGKFRVWLAVPVVAILFTTIHTFYVVSPDVFWQSRMIVLSMTAQTVRLITARLEVSIAVHVLMNVIVLIPSWLTIMLS